MGLFGFHSGTDLGRVGCRLACVVAKSRDAKQRKIISKSSERTNDRKKGKVK